MALRRQEELLCIYYLSTEKKKNTVSVTPVKKIKQFKVEYGDYTTSFQMFFKLVGKEKNTTLKEII